jgi:ABC-type antimicrobial peptide transport system permease subunit
VAADVKNRGLAQSPQVQLYLSFPQLPWGNMNLLVRTAVAPESVTPDIRSEIASVDPDQPVTSIRTAEELMDASRAQPRFSMILLGIFSATALILAMIGIYGVLAYSVAQRRQELGIRLALGAEQSRILRLVVGQGLRLALFGIALGLIAALVLTRLMAGVLYQVSTHDAVTFIFVPLVFLVIALLASYLPARRATRVDPLEALRSV